MWSLQLRAIARDRGLRRAWQFGLGEQPIVHHYRCGWQEPEQRFIKGKALICPKCRRELRHYGVDYDKPASVLVCRSCQKANPDPVVQFVYLDCANIVPAAEAKSVDWYRYELTVDGLKALREGRLPRLTISDRLEAYPPAFNPREFLLHTNRRNAGSAPIQSTVRSGSPHVY